MAHRRKANSHQYGKHNDSYDEYFCSHVTPDFLTLVLVPLDKTLRQSIRYTFGSVLDMIQR